MISHHPFSQDLLVTQSEYVRVELLSLQSNLQGLEVRASNIEADIRNAMSVGTFLHVPYYDKYMTLAL